MNLEERIFRGILFLCPVVSNISAPQSCCLRVRACNELSIRPPLCDLWLWRRSTPNSGQFLITLWVTGADANTCQGLLCKAQVSEGLLTPSTTWDRRAGPGSGEVAFSSVVSERINPSGSEKLTWGQL